MKNRGLITINVAIIVLLVIELALIACDLMLLAVFMSITVAIISVVIFVLNRGGESAIAAVANVGYALAITIGGIVYLLWHDEAIVLGFIIGGMSLIAQIFLTVARQQGRL
ncbi:MAG: hypothetical protein U0L97_00675 [Candidatus Saccharimonadaceae bacterium]|nr:hypothetical protein [Candidatus Saccharimonadaceae bacterium]